MPTYEQEPHFKSVHNAPQNVPLYRGTQIIWYIFYVIETLLLFRFILKLIGANAAAPFTDFIYTLSYPFAAPFLAVVRSARVEGSVIEWTTLLAMLVWWIAAWGIVKILAMSRPVSTVEAHAHLEDQEERSHTV